MNIFKDFIKPTAVLTAICVAVSAALVYTQGLTTPIIEKAKIAEAEKSRTEVLEKGDSFTKLELSNMPKGVLEAYKANNGAGYVISAASQGYGGPIVVMTGINSDGTIAKTKVISSNETPGQGSKVGEPDFTSRFEGKASDLSGIEKISGATISSNAFIGSVKLAFDTYKLANGKPVEEKDRSLTEKFMSANYPAGTKFTKLNLPYDAYKCGENGYIVSGDGEGYKGKITVAVLFNTKDEIINITVTELNDTKGLGTKIEDESFISQFKGKKAATGVDVIAGATISSKGFIAGVNNAIGRLPEAKGAK